MACHGRGITKEESLQAELDEQVQREEQQSYQLSDLRAQLERANLPQQSIIGRGRKLEDTKAAAKRHIGFTLSGRAVRLFVFVCVYVCTLE